MRTAMPIILLIDDEAHIRQILRVALESYAYRCLEASTGKEGLALVIQHRPDAILLDLGLPDMHGLSLLARLREWSQIPVIVISARDNELDKVSALDSGADDYLTKPFNTRELMARLRVALRHFDPSASGSPVFALGDWRVDLAQRRVLVEEKEVHLSPREFSIISSLIRHAGKVVTHHQILKEVWGDPTDVKLVNLRFYMNQLRHKLEKEPSRPRFLRTEGGVGYRLWIGE